MNAIAFPLLKVVDHGAPSQVDQYKFYICYPKKTMTHWSVQVGRDKLRYAFKNIGLFLFASHNYFHIFLSKCS